MKTDYLELFRLARAARKSVRIQNVSPAPSQGSRNIFKEDQVAIEAAAQKHGFLTIQKGKTVLYSAL